MTLPLKTSNSQIPKKKSEGDGGGGGDMVRESFCSTHLSDLTVDLFLVDLMAIKHLHMVRYMRRSPTLEFALEKLIKSKLRISLE